MRKEAKIFCRLAVLTLTFAFSCLVFVSPVAAKNITIKMGSYDPVLVLDHEKSNGEFASTNVKAQAFKAIIEQMTGGRIKVKVYPNGQLGDDMEMLEMLQAGTAPMSAYPGSPLPNFAPESLTVSISYIFKDVNVARRVVNGWFGDELAESIAKKSGIRVLAWGFEAPYYNFMSVKKRIRVPSDMKGQKIRTMEAPHLMEAVRVAGGTPTPISYSEMYTSLQQGVIDGVITGIPYAHSSKITELIKYVNKADPFMGISPLYASEKWWKKLSAEDRYLIKNAATQAMASFAGLVTWSEGTWVTFFKTLGIEVYTPNPKEMKVWRDTLKGHMLEWTRKKIGDEWVDKVVKASKEAQKAMYGF
jgi:C4-dicarboxylate-binding protein DctP